MIASSVSGAAITAWKGGPTYEVTYDKSLKKLKFVVTVPRNMYFALAFG